MEEQHIAAVAAISAQVRGFYDRKEPFRIYHGSTNCTRELRFPRDRIVDTTALANITRIDRLKRVALCEPNVSMEQLVHNTMRSHLIPKVVMEFPGITVGGAFAGTSGESSSFKHGFFENTVNWIEIILGNGEVVTASKNERSDLLEAAAGSFGTFGVITLLAVELVEAKSFVQLDFLPFGSVSQSMSELEKATDEATNDYVDGVLLNEDLGAIMVGNLKNSLPSDMEVVQFTRASDEWFYKYVEDRLAKDKTPFSIGVPILDYLFRYDRGVFWGAKYGLEYFCIPFNRATRYVFDSLLRSRAIYHALHESGLANQYIAQEIGFPSSKVGEFVDYLNEDFGSFPIWLCPLRKGHSIPLRPHAGSTAGHEAPSSEMLVKIGLWGPGPTRELEFINVNRRIEKKTRELGGFKCLYARAYYTETEFWDIYDRKWYEELRAKYNATTMPSVYDKISVDVSTLKLEPASPTPIWALFSLPSVWRIWPMAGLYGATMAFFGLYLPVWKDYVLALR